MPLKRSYLVVLLSLTFVAPTGVRAQSPSSNRPEEPVPDADIPRIVHEIDATNIERTIRKLVAFGTRNTLSAQDSSQRGIGAARDWLYGEFHKIADESQGRLTVTMQTFTQPVGPRVPTPTRLTNLIATLNGVEPTAQKRIYLVSGHYDSMCSSPTDAEHDAPGADDDASGVAAVLEMARVMSHFRFDATLVFAAVAGEEQGLLGSTYLAEQKKAEGAQLEGMFTNDIIGGTVGGNGVKDRHSVRVFAEGVPTDESSSAAAVRRAVGGENDSSSRQLARFIKEVGERYVPGMRVTVIYRRDRYLRGGDHIPFLERGFPAVRFTEPNEDYRHQHQNVRTENGIVYGDLPEFVDFAYVAQVARVNAASLAMLACAPAAPQDVGIVTRGLTNDTELRWQAGQEPDLDGYEVVWRETTAPFWTHHRRVGKVNSYIVKGLSKDNYFFGVRALDRQGHRSLVAFPRPVR